MSQLGPGLVELAWAQVNSINPRQSRVMLS